ncbi:MAG: DeoR/GlpR family DNA-binding transcription regulator [Hyphomicrobiales bacterium]
MSVLHPRQSDIVDRARQDGRVDVEGLAKIFNVSPQTIRKDLNDLCSMKLLQRIHGGAIYPSTVSNIAYLSRRSMAADAKQAIAQTAAGLISDDASLILNIGTTTEQVASELKRHSGLLVITNNLNVANTLGDVKDIDVVVAGGMVRKSDGGIVGSLASDMFRQFKVDYAVIGISAIDADGALLDFDYREVQVTKAIFEQARLKILVADNMKFNRRAPALVANIADLDVFVTDIAPPQRIIDLCKANDVELHVTGQGDIDQTQTAASV